jgi:type IV secretory pathway TrbL component
MKKRLRWREIGVEELAAALTQNSAPHQLTEIVLSIVKTAKKPAKSGRGALATRAPVIAALLICFIKRLLACSGAAG